MKQGHLYFLFIITWNRVAPVSSIPGVLAGLSVLCWHHWDWSIHSEKCQQILLLGNVFLLSKWGQPRGGGVGKKKKAREMEQSELCKPSLTAGRRWGCLTFVTDLCELKCVPGPLVTGETIAGHWRSKRGNPFAQNQELGVDPRCLVPLEGAPEWLSIPSHWALCTRLSCVGFNYLAFLHHTEMQSSWSILRNGAFSFKWALGLLLRPLYLI